MTIPVFSQNKPIMHVHFPSRRLAVRFIPLPIHVILAWSSNITPKDRGSNCTDVAREYLTNVFLCDRSTQEIAPNRSGL